MKAHVGKVVVQEGGCLALANLAFNHDNKVKIVSSGGKQAVQDAMRAHPEKGLLMLWGSQVLRT